MEPSELTALDYYILRGRYVDAIGQLPPRLKSVMPPFNKFISPANLSHFQGEDYTQRDCYYLSITGQERVRILNSPHYQTLIYAMAVKRLEKVLND
jgi:hypothetical protein